MPLAIVFGWPVVEEFIKGAHNMDAHFVETNPRHNLPVLLALSDIWNDIYLGSSGRIVTPFTESLAAFPALCAIMESQTCTRRNDDNGSSMALAGTTTAMTPMTTTSRIATPPVVIDGGLHNIYDGVLYQTDRTLPTELVMTLDTQVTANAIGTIGKRNMMRVFDTQDALMCSLFAQADELAFGNEARDSDNVGLDGGSAGRYGGISESGRRRDSFDWGSAAKAGSDGDASLGNRSSTVLVCSKCDAFMCGQLVAMVEHRVIVKARILGIDPFVRHVGSSFREKRTEQLREELRSIMEQDTIDEDEDDDGDGHGSGGTGNGMNLSTKTILQYYANLMKQQRAFIVANNNASISSSSINSTSR
uniref:Glucose-6-phosphate isomerase n=1 Tax=Craspedostauros australis TaxID=1486917 RepID=A0A7R9WUM5_9STRA